VSGNGELRAAAVALALEGLRVAPMWWPRDGRCMCGRPSCKTVGKHPIPELVPHGLSDASSDVSCIERWWDAYTLANLALATGFYADRGHLVAIDLDVRTDRSGLASFTTLAEAAGADLTSTLATRSTTTGGGGIHALFWSPQEIRNIQDGRLGTGIDVRGAGGGVIVGPSLHASGRRYQTTNARIGPIPDWLLREICERQPHRRPQGLAAPVPQLGGGAVPEDLEDMDAWGRCDEFARRLLEPYGIRVGERFSPTWRPSSGSNSAEVYRDGRGLLVCHDFGATETPASLLLVDLYAALVTGNARELGGFERVLWTKRAQCMLGYRQILEPPPLDHLQPFDADVFRSFWMRWHLRGEQADVGFSCRWAAWWLGIPERFNRVNAAINRLQRRGHLRLVRTVPSGYGRETRHFVLGDGVPEESAG